ncbi:MAG: hypothetical protein AAF927_05545 [Bacteroidota bacterium]
MLARLLFFSLLNLISFSLAASLLRPSIEYEVDLIRLIWTVAEDDAVESFVVERSEEEGYFTAVQEISALYYNSPALDFRFEDTDLTSGKAYRYRLRYRYPDGHNVYSETLNAYFETPEFVFHSLYAWPETLDQLGIDLSVHQGCHLKLSVLNPQGAVLYQEALKLSYGSHSLKMSFPELAEGYYYLRMESEKVIKLKAFVIQ